MITADRIARPLEGSRIDTLTLSRSERLTKGKIGSFSTTLCHNGIQSTPVGEPAGWCVGPVAFATFIGGGIENRRKSLNFSVSTDLSRDRQGRKVLLVAPEPHINEDPWLELIRSQSDADVARRLGVSDRQMRRIKTGKVSAARLREHAKHDQNRRGEVRRPRSRRVRAAFLLRRARDAAASVGHIAA